MLYLWLLEITKVRIRLQNYLFKADKLISQHLGHNRIFAADRMRILLQKIHRLLLHIQLLEITQVRYISGRQGKCHIQNLFGGYNSNYYIRTTKVFPVFRLFLDDKIIAQGQTQILSLKNNLNMGNTFVVLTE